MLTLETHSEIALKNMERLEGRELRMVWAGSIANGAMIVAIVGLIGNTDDPDAAARFFLWPLIFLGSGVFLSGLAALAHTYVARLRVTLSGTAAYFPIVKSNFKEDEGAAIDAATAAYNTLTRKDHTDDDEMGVDRSEPGTAINTLAKLIRTRFNAVTAEVNLWSKVSDGLFIGSLALLVVAGGMSVRKLTHGERIQPVAAHAAPSPAAGSAAKH